MLLKFHKVSTLKSRFLKKNLGIRSKLKNFRILLDFRRPKKFNTYEEALSFCEKKMCNSIDLETFAHYRFEKFNNFLKKGGNCINTEEVASLLFVVALFMQRNKGKCPKIIIFGGACGKALIALEKIYGEEIFQNSWIVETEEHVQESKKWEFASKMNFSSDVRDVISSNKIDIFFTSGTIRFLQDPLLPIEIAIDKSIPIIALVKNILSPYKVINAQESNLSSNGIGEHITKYGDSKIYFPNTSIDNKYLVKLFKSKAYEVILENIYKKSYKQTVFSGDFVFQKNSY